MVTIYVFQVIVLMVGTNNHGDTAEEVTAGIMAIVKAILDKQPASNLIVVVRLRDHVQFLHEVNFTLANPKHPGSTLENC